MLSIEKKTTKKTATPWAVNKAKSVESTPNLTWTFLTHVVM